MSTERCPHCAVADQLQCVLDKGHQGDCMFAEWPYAPGTRCTHCNTVALADPVREALVELFSFKPNDDNASLVWVTEPSESEITYKNISIGAMYRLEAAIRLAEGKE